MVVIESLSVPCLEHLPAKISQQRSLVQEIVDALLMFRNLCSMEHGIVGDLGWHKLRIVQRAACT